MCLRSGPYKFNPSEVVVNSVHVGPNTSQAHACIKRQYCNNVHKRCIIYRASRLRSASSGFVYCFKVRILICCLVLSTRLTNKPWLPWHPTVNSVDVKQRSKIGLAITPVEATTSRQGKQRHLCNMLKIWSKMFEFRRLSLFAVLLTVSISM